MGANLTGGRKEKALFRLSYFASLWDMEGKIRNPGISQRDWKKENVLAPRSRVTETVRAELKSPHSAQEKKEAFTSQTFTPSGTNDQPREEKETTAAVVEKEKAGGHLYWASEERSRGNGAACEGKEGTRRRRSLERLRGAPGNILRRTGRGGAPLLHDRKSERKKKKTEHGPGRAC